MLPLNRILLVSFCILAVLAAVSVDSAFANELLPWKPMPMPVRTVSAEDDTVSPPGNVVSYDVETGETVYRLASAVPEPEGGQGFVPGRRGEAPEFQGTGRGGPQPNFGPYTATPDPASYPYSTHVRLAMKFLKASGDTSYYFCSGTLIDPMHVVTAGHCVYDRDRTDHWAVEVEVVPAYTNGVKPYGSAHARELHSWSGWMTSEDYDHDVALVDLDHPIGCLTGWRGYGWTNSCNYFTGGSWVHHAYPGEDGFDGETMQTNEGDFDGCDELWGGWYGNEVWAERPGIGGTSGGGAVRDNVVWAVRSNTTTYPDFDRDAFDCRITSGKFNDIESYMEEDKGEFWELIPVDVQSSDSSLAAGDYLNAFNVGVTNYANGTFASTLQINAYLSPDPDIDPTDVLLGSYAGFQEIGPLGFIRVTLPGWRIPPDLSDGQYYLGVVILTIDEDESNNISRPADTVPLWIGCPAMPAVQKNAPANKSTCVPTSTTLTWAAVPNAAGYQVRFGTGCYSRFEVYSTPVPYLDLTNLDPGQYYFWNVRAASTCQPGTYGPWGSCSSFRTADSTPWEVALASPADGLTCQDIGVVLDWNSAPYADLYHVQIGTSCGTGAIYPVEQGTDLTVSGLLYNRTYYWRVRGRSGCGENGPWSECRSLTTAGSELAAPTIIAPADGATCVSATQWLSWNTVAGADSYLVRYGPSGCFADADTAFVVTGTSIPFPEALPDVTYWWSVQAFDGCRQLGYSTPCRSFTVAGPGPAPPSSTMEPGTHRPCDNADVLLIWNSVPGATGYQIRFSPQCDGRMPTYTTTDRWYTFTSLAPDVYFWQLRVKGTCDTYGSWSPCTSFTVDTIVPGTVSGLGSPTHIAGTWSNRNGIAFSWREPKDPFDEDCGTPRYSVLLDHSPTTLPDFNPEVDTPEYTVNPVADGTDYWFHVRMIDAGGNPSPDAVHVGPYRIDTVAPSATLLSPNGGEQWPAGTQQTIQWLASDDVSGVRDSELRYSTDGGATFTAIATLPPGTGTYDWTIPDIPSGVVLVEVAVTDSAGTTVTDRSDGTLSILTQTGVGDPSGMYRTRLLPNHPNPFRTSTTLTFTLAEEGAVNLTVFDAGGRVVRRLAGGTYGSGLHSLTWNGTDDAGRRQSSGVYFLRLETEDGARMRRLLFMR